MLYTDIEVYISCSEIPRASDSENKSNISYAVQINNVNVRSYTMPQQHNKKYSKDAKNLDEPPPQPSTLNLRPTHTYLLSIPLCPLLLPLLLLPDDATTTTLLLLLLLLYLVLQHYPYSTAAAAGGEVDTTGF